MIEQWNIIGFTDTQVETCQNGGEEQFDTFLKSLSINKDGIYKYISGEKKLRKLRVTQT